MALEENKEIISSVEQPDIEPVATKEPTYKGFTLEQWQGTFPEMKSLPVEQKFPDKGDESEFWYGFDKTPSFVNNAYLYFEAVNPVFANSFSDKTPDEIYGEGFTDLSVEQRRQVLVDYRKDQLKREYPVLSQIPEDELSWQSTMGGLTSLIYDPTTLVPFGAGFNAVKLLAAGSALGGSFNLADQLANKQEVDLTELTAMTAASGVGTVALGKGLQVLGNKIKLAQSKRSTGKEMKKANEEIDKINYVLTKASAEDKTITQAQKMVQEELGINQDDLIKILSKTDRKPVFPSKTAAKVSLDVINKGTKESDRVTNGFFEHIIGNLSTKLGKTSKYGQSLKLRLRDMERKIHTTRGMGIETIQPFLQTVKKLPKNLQDSVSIHLFNQDFNLAIKTLKDNVGKNSVEELNAVTKLIDDLGKMREKSGGTIKNKIDNYFPRSVKDFDGLQQELGKNKVVKGVYDEALAALAKALSTKESKVLVSDLTQKQKEDVIAKVSQGHVHTGIKNKKLTWARDRKIPKVTERLLPYYDDLETSLKNYINSISDDIHKRQFLGKSNVEDAAGGYDLNLENSVANLINRNLSDISVEEQALIKQLINTRFANAEVAPHKFLRSLRDFGYAVTLANPISALTQVKDVGMSAYVNGLIPTLKSVFGKKNVEIGMKKFGLDNIIASEFSTLKDASSMLHNLLGLSLFRRVDRFGKDVFLNSSYKRAQALSKTKAGTEKLAKKYKKAFGEGEFNLLLNDLKTPDQITERVKLYLWSELSDVQPIALSEMPQTYLNKPDGRIFYSLKSFAIKQLDLIRRTITDQYRQGNTKEATKNLVAYTALVSLMGGTVDETKDLIMGRGFNVDDVATDGAVNNLLNVVGFNKYSVDKIGRDPTAGIVNLFVPPIPLINSLVEDASNIMEDKDADIASYTLKEVPVVGKLTYQWLGGGLEKDLKREAKERKQERIFK